MTIKQHTERKGLRKLPLRQGPRKVIKRVKKTKSLDSLMKSPDSLVFSETSHFEESTVSWYDAETNIIMINSNNPMYIEKKKLGDDAQLQNYLLDAATSAIVQHWYPDANPEKTFREFYSLRMYFFKRLNA